MRRCEKCGKEFEGTVCPECGAEYESGKKICPQCGAEQSTDAKYCRSCSAPLSKTVICTVCGTEDTDGNNYCENCGAQIRKLNAKDRKKVLTIFGAGCLIFSALIGLIFTFLAGVTLSVDIGGIKMSDSQTLYYYFGEVYKDADTIRETIKSQFDIVSIGDKREFALMFPAVLGTVISALGILGAVGLSGLTAWCAYKKFCKKRSVNLVAPAVGTYFCFVTFATALLSLSAESAGTAKVGFSVTTLVGLILGGVFCGLGVFSLAFSNGERVKRTSSRLGLCSSIFVTCIFIVIIALCSQPAVGLRFKNLNVEELNGLSGNFGLFPIMQSMLLTVEDEALIEDIVSFGSIGGVVGIAVAIISAVIVWRKLTGIAECENKPCFVICLVAVFAAVLYFVSSIVMLNHLFDTIYTIIHAAVRPTIWKDELYKYVSKIITVPIVIMVMPVVASAIERIFKDK